MKENLDDLGQYFPEITIFKAIMKLTNFWRETSRSLGGIGPRCIFYLSSFSSEQVSILAKFSGGHQNSQYAKFSGDWGTSKFAIFQWEIPQYFNEKYHKMGLDVPAVVCDSRGCDDRVAHQFEANLAAQMVWHFSLLEWHKIFFISSSLLGLLKLPACV